MASVRFICGTQEIHTRARGAARAPSSAPRTRSSTAPASTPTAACSRRCSTSEDAVISDGSTTPRSSTASACARRAGCATPTATWPSSRRGCARRRDARCRLIATDGVFSMDGYLAQLDEICDLAERYGALVMVDDSHAVGFVGPSGRGTPEHYGVDRPRRHPHRHARQGARRRERRLRRRAARDRRAAAPALAAVPVLQQRRAAGRRREPARARAARGLATSSATGCARTPRASAPA